MVFWSFILHAYCCIKYYINIVSKCIQNLSRNSYKILRAIEKRVAICFRVGVVSKGVVVCIPWAHLSVGVVKMQHIMAFVTGISVCPGGIQHQPFLMVSVTVSLISMYANDVEGKTWESI